MISNEILQKALVTRMKANTGITDVLNGSTEVREQQWQGRTFTYPAIRLALGTQAPRMEMEVCTWSRLSFSVLCLSEDRSSKEADQLAGAVSTAFHKTAWTVSADSFRFHQVRSAGLNSAIRMSERVWRAEAFFIADIHTI